MTVQPGLGVWVAGGLVGAGAASEDGASMTVQCGAWVVGAGGVGDRAGGGTVAAGADRVQNATPGGRGAGVVGDGAGGGAATDGAHVQDDTATAGAGVVGDGAGGGAPAAEAPV